MVVLSLSIVIFLALAKIFKLDVLELDAEVFADHFATGQDRDVFEHRLTTITKARGLDGRDVQRATQLVDDQRCQRLALRRPRR